MRKKISTLLTCSVLLALSACGLGSSGSDTDSDDTIKIGTLFSVSGAGANLGDKMRKGAELAVKQVNADGGIDGKKIDWVFYDPAGDTSTAVQQTNRMLDSDGVELIVGGGGSSGIALAMDPITSGRGVAFIATEGARQIVEPAAEAHPLTFKTTFNDTVMVERLIAFWKAHDITRVAFMPDTSSFGQSAQEELERLAPEAGIKVFTAAFDPAANDLTPQVKRLAGNDPQAYLAWTITPAGVTFLKNLRSVLGDSDVMVMHGFGFVDDRYMQQAGAASTGTILVSPKLPVWDRIDASDPQQPVMEDFATAYAEEYGGEQPNVYAGQAYDAMMVAVAALRATGGDTDGEKIADAVEALGTHVGVTGAFKFTADDHSGLTVDDVAVIQWDGSRFVPVE
ncbi:ABC transporter substrate-binding protein [Nocardioides carbamazepini]|jgi:branched-chain amino acid transport system substrate-binding protein|uniref:ABC transporter substrate-binding protein n=1 Tax=Nocardioides carbamazepini TaxID=2854259 RepID=UPI00214A126B|nr:ABC transporter substrate-binding protein [Nocardioides carbamazepini]MCR1784784.1 ABC transporter substrate-binding protein [Nocardioides carbamazepini]